MDENTWRFAQLMMWLIGVQTTVIIASFSAMWIALSKKIDQVDKRLEKIEVQVNDIDKRLFAIETMLHMKDCCVLKDDRQSRRAE